MLANVRTNLGLLYLTGADRQRAFDQARAALDRATLLAPDSPATLTIRGYLLQILDDDPVGALDATRRALAAAPNSGAAMYFLAIQLDNMGRLQEALDLQRKAMAIDPLRSDWYVNLSQYFAGLGRYEEAKHALHQALALQQVNPIAYFNLSQVLDCQGRVAEAERAVHKALEQQPGYGFALAQISVLAIERGDATAAIRAAGQIADPDLKDFALTMARQIGRDRVSADAALDIYLHQYGKDIRNAIEISDLYATRRQPNEMFQWLQRAATHKEQSRITDALLTDTMLLRYRYDPRFAALCRQLDLPVPDVIQPPAKALSTRAATATTGSAR